MSKHRLRRERRSKYYAYIDTQLSNENAFVARIIATLDHGGFDNSTLDGKTIRPHFRRYIESRQKANPTAALACVDLLERAIRKISIQPCSRR